MAAQASTRLDDALGYCYGCDRQVQINLNDFICSICGNGFIELLDDDNDQRPMATATTTTQPATNTRPVTARGRGSGPIISGNLARLLFQSLPSQPPSSSASANAEVGWSSADPRDASSQSRIQFIVPGEQYDLYGMINNIFSDILNPTATAAAASAMGGARPRHAFTFTQHIHGDPRDYAWGSAGLDSIITQLLNQLESTGPAPATETQLNGLPSEKITLDHIEKNCECAICMDEYKLNDETKKLPCKHYFHTSCIVQWLRLHGTCPVCRKTLNGEDTSQNEYVRPPSAPAPTPNPGSQPGQNEDRDQTSYYDPMDFD